MGDSAGKRISFVGGLALFWPFLQGPYFSMFFNAQSPYGGWALPFALNACALLFSIIIYILLRIAPAFRRWVAPLVVGFGLVSTLLLVGIVVGIGGAVAQWLGVVGVAASFAGSAWAWGCLAVCTCARRSFGAVLVDVALSYAGCYLIVFFVGAVPVPLQPLLLACCPVLSSTLWWIAQRGESSDLGENTREVTPMSRLAWVLPATVACLALVSAVLAGLYSDVPARSYVPSALCALLLVGCAAGSRRSALWSVAFWALALVPVLMSGFCLMTTGAELVAVGIDALTVGRRLIWVLYWWLLVGLPRERALRVLAWGFVPLYVATRWVIDGLRMGGVGPGADPQVVSLIAMTVAFVLVVGSLAVVGLAVARVLEERRPGEAEQRSQSAGGRPSSEDARAAACRALAVELGLTERECDVLGLVSMGYTVQRIAEERGVSQNTVRTHTKGLYRKLGIHTKQEAIEMVNARMA